MINSGGWEASDQLLPGRASLREVRTFGSAAWLCCRNGEIGGDHDPHWYSA